MVAFRVVLVLVVVLNYEPVLTSKFCTTLQWAMGIRVRRFEALDERIPLPAAYSRFVVKTIFGFFSFFAMGFDKERRALHDFIADSVVVDAQPSSATLETRRPTQR